jgi:hypothetical protein
MSEEYYFNKYLKYKSKYVEIKGGGNVRPPSPFSKKISPSNEGSPNKKKVTSEKSTIKSNTTEKTEINGYKSGERWTPVLNNKPSDCTGLCEFIFNIFKVIEIIFEKYLGNIKFEYDTNSEDWFRAKCSLYDNFDLGICSKLVIFIRNIKNNKPKYEYIYCLFGVISVYELLRYMNNKKIAYDLNDFKNFINKVKMYIDEYVYDVTKEAFECADVSHNIMLYINKYYVLPEKMEKRKNKNVSTDKTIMMGTTIGDNCFMFVALESLLSRLERYIQLIEKFEKKQNL